MKLSFGRRFLACSPLVLVVLAGASSHRALADSDPAEGHSVATPQAQTLVIHARPSPNLILQGGREVKYVGLFSADANFHGSSKLNRFLDNATRAPVPDTSQNAVPAMALHCYVRFKEDYDPPARAVAIPEVHSLAGRALDSVVTAVYGHRVVLLTPQRVTTDSRQRLIVSDPGIPAVHVLDPKKKTSFSILGGQGRRLQAPAGVAVDAEDNIYIADSSRGLVLVYDQYGTFIRYIGTVDGEPRYHRPAGIAIDQKAGRLYLADTERNVVHVLDLQGNLLAQAGGLHSKDSEPVLRRREQAGQGVFNAPTEIAVGENTVAVLDSGGSRVRILDLQGNLRGTFHASDDKYQSLDVDNGLAIDTQDNIYVLFVGSSEIRLYDREGKLLAGFGQQGFRQGEFFFPRGLWIDGKNRLFVSDTGNHRVQLFQLGMAALNMNADSSEGSKTKARAISATAITAVTSPHHH